MNKKQKQLAQLLGELFLQGIKAWGEAGKIVKELLDGGTTMRDIIQTSGVSRHDVTQFYLIGEGKLYPGLAISNTPGAMGLRKCELPEQIKYVHNPVRILEPVTRKKRIVRDIPLNELTIPQAARAFNKGEVRTVAEQDVYLDEKEREEDEQAEQLLADKPDYRIYADRIEVKRKTTITKEELDEIIRIINDGLRK